MLQPSHLEVVPLGGLGEFGMNLMVYRYGAECLVVDAGMMFPGAEHLGVDVVIPNLSFLDACGRLRGVVLTHGHEDHIGALPYLLARHEVPVFGTAYTLGLVRARLAEHDPGLASLLHPLPVGGEPLQLGPFAVRALPVTHSIPHSVLLVLHTPVGTVVHTGDYKLDPTSADGWATDLAEMAALGRQGVLAVFGDSTNADRPGWTPGEATVRPAFDALLASAPRRVLVTLFSSNVQRMQLLCDLARRHGRRVAFVGSSMVSHAAVAEEMGLLDLPVGLRVDAETAMSLPPEKALLLVTGSQGEPTSALARIAVGKHREVEIGEGDRVIHAARAIPGSQKAIGRMVNHLLRRGAEVVDETETAVHVSGHAAEDELRLVLHLLRPRFLVPVHGEFRQLSAHARLAGEMTAGGPHTVLADTGDLLALSPGECRVVDRVPVGQVFIDATLEEVDFQLLRERKQIAGDGLVVPVVAVDPEGQDLPGRIEIVSRGFLAEDGNGLFHEAKQVLADSIASATPEERGDEGLLKARLHTDLKRFLRRRTQRRPLIIPIILEL
ncbi:MAG TPA: ribonuclease J [Candidatus Polarisedimenticolaceae bacterium]|nr:ribonuclease J [Candidatus Polarisedimenticolaceae bacterium]